MNTLLTIIGCMIFSSSYVTVLTTNHTHPNCQYDKYEHVGKDYKVENDADYLLYYLKVSELMMRDYIHYSWNYETNATDVNAKLAGACSHNQVDWSNKQFEVIKRLNRTNLNSTFNSILDELHKSMYILPDDLFKRYQKANDQIVGIYVKAQVVLDNGTRLTPGESGVENFYKNERDYDKLSEVWKKWRDETGKKIRPYFLERLNVSNQTAVEQNYSDYGKYKWYLAYNDETFNQKVIDLYEKVKPLYQELHAYVRYKLSLVYKGRLDAKGPLPAHLLGNVWAQDWSGIFNFVKPYSNVSDMDITKGIKAKNWTMRNIAEKAEDFFVSIGLHKMTNMFWNMSIFENPGNRPFNCHATAFDMGDRHDFRIKMCGEGDGGNFYTVHHEMGHVEYYMCYKHQPVSFREGANEAFHEAIGDTIALSVMTNTHLRKMGLVPDEKLSKEQDINILMHEALNKVAFLPFALTMDVWIWRISNGSVPQSEYNKEWWRLRLMNQGLNPPIPRSEEDLDPCAKYHITENLSYIRYFISYLLQFQFYDAMCQKAGHQGPLHQCDFYQSKPAGSLLKSVLEMGSSQPWQDALEKMTGKRDVSTDSIEKYFAPLKDWLMTQRKAIGYAIGW